MHLTETTRGVAQYVSHPCCYHHPQTYRSGEGIALIHGRASAWMYLALPTCLSGEGGRGGLGAAAPGCRVSCGMEPIAWANGGLGCRCVLPGIRDHVADVNRLIFVNEGHLCEHDFAFARKFGGEMTGAEQPFCAGFVKHEL